LQQKFWVHCFVKNSITKANKSNSLQVILNILLNRQFSVNLLIMPENYFSETSLIRLNLQPFQMKKYILVFWFLLLATAFSFGQKAKRTNKDFAVKGFHLDLRIQVMTMDALKAFAQKLHQYNINTLVMEWEATYPFQKHVLIPNRYAYTREEITSFVKYCKDLNIDVIPLQQSFGHVEYILRNNKYQDLREDQKDYSQVCPLETDLNKALFTDLFSDLAVTHPSKYFHIGGDETYLLGHCEKCQKKAATEGKSKLYIDHIRMLCDIVIKQGKQPVLWADIALKYPEAIKLLPKETIFVDWNYGWDLNRFGDLNKLLETGYEIWGAPSLRSGPDNYFLTLWENHFNNIRDFIPTARKLGYKGMVMTSWSTSGLYSTVFENTADIIDLYAMWHRYPLTGYNMLLAAYAEGLKSDKPLQVKSFIEKYAKDTYGFNKAEARTFWKALSAAPYNIRKGKVQGENPIPIPVILDSTILAAKALNALKPTKNKEEFEHYKLMTDIRVQYLAYQNLESQVNSDTYTAAQTPAILPRLQEIITQSAALNKRFIALNKNYYYTTELQEENRFRNVKAQLLYDRLAKVR